MGIFKKIAGLFGRAPVPVENDSPRIPPKVMEAALDTYDRMQASPSPSKPLDTPVTETQRIPARAPSSEAQNPAPEPAPKTERLPPVQKDRDPNLKMERWKEDFISMLKQGVPEHKACMMAAGLNLADVQAAREADFEFGVLWDSVKPPESQRGKRGKLPALHTSRVLDPASLGMAARAGCTEDETAGFFGLTVKEFQDRIAADAELGKVWTVADKGGKAELRITQHHAAMEGNTALLTWMGKQRLAQSEKVDTTVKVENEIDNTELARRIAFIMATSGRPVLDGQATEVMEETDRLAIERSVGNTDGEK